MYDDSKTPWAVQIAKPSNVIIITKDTDWISWLMSKSTMKILSDGLIQPFIADSLKSAESFALDMPRAPILLDARLCNSILDARIFRMFSSKRRIIIGIGENIDDQLTKEFDTCVANPKSNNSLISILNLVAAKYDLARTSELIRSL